MSQRISCAAALALAVLLQTLPAAARNPHRISELPAATIVQLQEGTATYSQTCCGPDILGSPALAIDGVFSDIFGQTLNGWAVVQIVDGVETSKAETAVWETASDVGPGPLRFVMFFLHANPKHLLGRFRFSVTTDDRTLFADGTTRRWSCNGQLDCPHPQGDSRPCGDGFLETTR
jgi:hypothetical protein